jgi:hypothetical protein
MYCCKSQSTYYKILIDNMPTFLHEFSIETIWSWDFLFGKFATILLISTYVVGNVRLSRLDIGWMRRLKLKCICVNSEMASLPSKASQSNAALSS